MKAVIMAGGFGTRLRPITCNIPKPMAPVANVPMMEHIVGLLKKYDMNRICSILYFQPEVITNYFGDGKKFGIDMEYQMAAADYGTAGSVKNTEEKLKGEPFIIISGDVLTDFDLAKAIEFHKKNKAMATLVLTKVDNPLEYGVVITAEDGKIVRFLEKPSWGEVFSDTINTGIYILEPEIFDLIPAKTEFDFSKNLFPLMLEKKLPLYGYIADGYWKDIGSLDEYINAHQDVLNGNVTVDLRGDRIGGMGKDVIVGKNVKINKSKTKFKGGVVIGDNVVIEDGCSLENCVIGDNCVVGKGSSLKGATVWADVKIGERTVIDKCVIGGRTVVEDGAKIASGAIIAEDCFIGRDAVIRENIKIWPKKQVEEGSTVLSSLIYSDKWNKNLFTDFGISGLANIEITPEMACKLGCAYGSSLPKGSTVICSRDCTKVARIVNRAIMCGIASAGVNVSDLRCTPEPVARFKPNAFNRTGGVHIKMADDNPNNLEIKIFDQEGRDIATGTKKSIERLFNREDFRRANVIEVGEISFPPRVPENYSEELLRHVDTDIIKSKKMKIVVDFQFSEANSIFNSFLGKLGVDVITLNAYHDEDKIWDLSGKQSRENVPTMVKSLNADLGIIMGNGSENITMVDNTGRIIEGQQAMLTWAKMIFDLKPGATIAVPVSATHQLEKMAEKSKGKVVRTKTSVRALNDAALNKENEICLDEKGGIIFSHFQAAFDGIFASVKLIEAVAKLDKKLSDIVDSVPESFTRTTKLPCPWEAKGKVMRYSMEFAKDKETQLIDGVKILMNKTDWVLVLPDSDKPFVNLTVESTSAKKSEELLKTITDKVNTWEKAE